MVAKSDKGCTSCGYEAAISVLTCAKCERNTHYNGSKLPPYYISQIEKSKTEYFCLPCITMKKENRTQIKAIENEIANHTVELEGESSDEETEKTELRKQLIRKTTTRGKKSREIQIFANCSSMVNVNTGKKVLASDSGT